LKQYWIIPFGLAIVLALLFWQFLPLTTALVAWLLAINVIAFFTYWYDKSIAGTGATRVPEIVLVALAAAGGWPMALVSMRLFHHKTGKASQDFRNKFWVGVVIGLVAFGIAFWLF
jgi:uncharacterized membrane protein YsdA (DUF1294 family)